MAGAAGGIVSLVPAAPRIWLATTTLAVMLGFELAGRPLNLPQNRRLVPQDVIRRADVEGPLQFGFEMGTGMRTYSPSALPHLALAAVVLVVPLPVAPAVAAGFAAGRLAMPVMSNGWSDDGSWTEVWSAAERVVRPVLASACVGALIVGALTSWY